MRWTERQRAMLDEIGIRLWLPPTASPTTPDAVDAAISEAPVRDPAARAPMPARADVVGPVNLALDTDIGSLDAPALAARAAVCTACALCGGRTRSVFGAGAPRADWMIVGDAPDADDDRAGTPFAGRAGQLLDNMLAALRLTRGAADPSRRAYLTHAVKCRPPDSRKPEAAELQACAPFLSRQVALVQPRIIVAMGRIAAQALVGSVEPTARLRGRVHRFADVPVVVTAHPAYLLRHPQDKAAAWEDLCLALEVVSASNDAPRPL
jgi:uracil-DNA glycosylase family 4